MDYIELCFSMPQEKVDLVSTFLVAGGYDTFEICDLSDLLENAGAMFCDYIEDNLLEQQSAPPAIKFYMEKEEREKAEEILAFVMGVSEKLGWNDVSGAITLVENSDWDTRWKQYFYPFPVGERLFIKPAWEDVDEDLTRGRAIIEIDPAAAFGSGTHATTRLCLESLEKVIRQGDRVLDMGCGSGILAIGAKKLGAGKMVAVDIDEAAVRTSRENFEKNGVPLEDVTLICGNILAEKDKLEEMGKGFDLILANIVAQIIKDMAPLLLAALKPGGTLLASGILESREEEVKKTLMEAGFTYVCTHASDEWVCMELTR
ncbi:MAG: 50S ribosomal protein L11 methyltransferase [Clostridia bacterium]|nr:50S ribosomal protein L11 methyltransferase [Clostridia bacterium]